MQNILRLPDVINRTGLKRPTIYSHMAQGKFPKPVPITGRSVGWLEAEIAEWQAARIAEREAAGKAA